MINEYFTKFVDILNNTQDLNKEFENLIFDVSAIGPAIDSINFQE